jgi:hypothetical protein
MKTGTGKLSPKASRRKIKQAILASEVAKAEAHTRAFLMINLNPQTYESRKNHTEQPRP